VIFMSKRGWLKRPMMAAGGAVLPQDDFTKLPRTCRFQWMTLPAIIFVGSCHRFSSRVHMETL
jgi:hypothetical protein